MTASSNQGWFKRLFGGSKAAAGPSVSPEAAVVLGKVRSLEQLRDAIKQPYMKDRVGQLCRLIEQIVTLSEESEDQEGSLAYLTITVDQAQKAMTDFVSLITSGLDPTQEQRLLQQVDSSLGGLINSLESQRSQTLSSRIASLSENLKLLDEFSEMDTASQEPRFHSPAIQLGHRIPLQREYPHLDTVVIGASWHVAQYNGTHPFNLVPMCIPVGRLATNHPFNLSFGRPDSGHDVARCAVPLASVPPEVEQLLFVIAIQSALKRGQNFSKVESLAFRILDSSGEELLHDNEPSTFTLQTVVIGPVLYRRSGSWRLVMKKEGFKDGMKGLHRAYSAARIERRLLDLDQ